MTWGRIQSSAADGRAGGDGSGAVRRGGGGGGWGDETAVRQPAVREPPLAALAASVASS